METLLIEKKHTSDLTDEELLTIYKLLRSVNGEEFSVDNLSNALGGCHFLAYDSEELVGHVAVVQRSILLDNKPHKVGYLECIGVTPLYQNRGIEQTLIKEVNILIDKCYHFGAVSPSEEMQKLYEELGWITMLAPYYEYTLVGIVPSSDKCVMTYSERLSLKPKNKLVCDYRDGSSW